MEEFIATACRLRKEAGMAGEKTVYVPWLSIGPAEVPVRAEGMLTMRLESMRYIREKILKSI